MTIQPAGAAFWGVVNGSPVALTTLKQRGGALINVGSEVSETVIPLHGMRSASKPEDCTQVVLSPGR